MKQHIQSTENIHLTQKTALDIWYIRRKDVISQGDGEPRKLWNPNKVKKE